MRIAHVNGLRTAYYVAGKDSHNILFLHGWASSGRMWLRSMWALRRGFRVWALDLPGFGSSQVPSFEWVSIERYTDHVAAFCQAQGIRLQAVVGHSMGGRIALDLVRRYPHLVEQVVAVAPTITGRLGFNLNVFMNNGLGDLLVNLSRRVWPIATTRKMSYYLSPPYLDDEQIMRAATDLHRSSWEAAIGSLRAVVRQDYSPYLAEIKHPTLVICGARDFTVPPADSHLAARCLPNAHLLVLPNVHHWPSDEAPDLFLQAVRTFIGDGHLKAATA